jgi:hypothetical protein
LAITLAALVLAGAARAQDEDAGRPLRLLGEAPAIGVAGPTRFVIDATAKKGFDAGETDVEGWFAATSPPAPNSPYETASGSLDGKCLDGHCVLTAQIEDHKVILHGDLIGAAGAVQGRFEVAGELPADQLTKGAASFTPFTDTVPGLGVLVAANAVDSRALDDLLLWAGIEPAFFDDGVHPMEGFQREHLAQWQRNNNRPGVGLLFAADLALLESQREKAQKDAGWTPLSGSGWAAGYPAALLPNASRNGSEQRFASADGKASLVVAIDPPISDDDFDKLVDKLTNLPSKGYTRVGPNMQISTVEAGKATSTYYYNRPGGLARLVYTYPDSDNPYSAIDLIVSRSLRVTDALKPTP